MKRLHHIFLISIFSGNLCVQAQTADWSSKVAHIIYDHCAPCHYPGGAGPFPLLTYDDAVLHAFGIQAQVNARLMPPFPADPDCSAPLAKNRRLSQSDIDALNEWINLGMPAGNLQDAPAPPAFGTGSALDYIDYSFQFPVYTVPSATDHFRTFVLPSNFSTVHYLNQIEFQISNPEIVHHILLYYDPTLSSWNKDQDDPGPGFSSSGTGSPSPSAVLIAGWVPGMEPERLPVNFGYEIPANAYFAMEIHYAPNSLGKTDSTRVNIKFCNHPDPRPIYVSPVLFHYWPSLTNGPLVIPPNTIKTFYEKSTISTGDFSIYSILPHAHLICTQYDVYMTGPNPTDTTRLLCLPRWDFRWQMSYPLQKLIRFTPGAGYKLGARATYDNTVNNPNNPNNPPAYVTLGEKTTDEMMVVFFGYLTYQPGDENLDLQVGTESLTNQEFLLQVHPNPAVDQIGFSAWIESGPVQFSIYNASGRVVLQRHWGLQPRGAFAGTADVSALPAGFYVAELRSAEGRRYASVVKH